MCLSTFLPQKDRDPDLILAQCAQGKMWLKAADYLVFIKHLHQISVKSFFPADVDLRKCNIPRGERFS